MVCNTHKGKSTNKFMIFVCVAPHDIDDGNMGLKFGAIQWKNTSNGDPLVLNIRIFFKKHQKLTNTIVFYNNIKASSPSKQVWGRLKLIVVNILYNTLLVAVNFE
jgi:hypothetical protein